MTADEESIRLAELSATIEAALGYPLDKETFNALADIQMRLQRTQIDLALRLDRGLISAEEYLRVLNMAVRSAMAESRMLLGEGRFHAIFGKAGHWPEGLIDKEKFLSKSSS